MIGEPEQTFVVNDARRFRHIATAAALRKSSERNSPRGREKGAWASRLLRVREVAGYSMQVPYWSLCDMPTHDPERDEF